MNPLGRPAKAKVTEPQRFSSRVRSTAATPAAAVRMAPPGLAHGLDLPRSWSVPASCVRVQVWLPPELAQQVRELDTQALEMRQGWVEPEFAAFTSVARQSG